MKLQLRRPFYCNNTRTIKAHCNPSLQILSSSEVHRVLPKTEFKIIAFAHINWLSCLHKDVETQNADLCPVTKLCVFLHSWNARCENMPWQSQTTLSYIQIAQETPLSPPLPHRSNDKFQESSALPWTRHGCFCINLYRSVIIWTQGLVGSEEFWYFCIHVHIFHTVHTLRIHISIN